MSGKEPTCQCRRPKRHRFDPWVRKLPWRRAWQLTPVFSPGESHGHRSLEGYYSYGCKELDTTEATEHAHTLLLFTCSLCLTLCDLMDCSMPGFPVLHHLSESARLMSIESMVHPTILSSVIPFSSCLLSFPATGSFPVSQLFRSDGQSIGCLSFNISPSNEHPGLISYRMD